jgi:formamidopyrimidine-DNA glycosylase
MPELPEVETLCRGLKSHLEGAIIERVICRRKDLRFPLPKAFSVRLSGARITKVDRRAKYLLFHLSNSLIVLSHLGMSGRFRIEEALSIKRPGAFYDTSPEKTLHDHVIIDLNRQRRLVYNDTRRFGFMELLKKSELARRFLDIGCEPLSKNFTAKKLREVFQHKKMPIKAALLDQKLIAGIGNIYACEALFEAGISPFKAASNLSSKECEKLKTAIQAVLKQAIRHGGSTLRDFHNENSQSGTFQNEFKVYDRKGLPCPSCKTPVERIIQSGRSSFYCPLCQS